MKRNLYMLALSALAIDVCLAGSFNYDWDVSSPQSSFGGASYKEAAQRIFAAEEWVQ